MRSTYIRFLVVFLVALSTVAVFGQPQYKIERLNDHISSTPYDEIGPIISQDGLTLYFTRVKSPDFVRTLYYQDEDLSQAYVPSAYDFELGTIFGSLEGGARVLEPSQSSFNQDIWIATLQPNLEYDQVLHPGYPLNNALPNSICSTTPDRNMFVVLNQFPKSGGMEKGFSLVSKTDSGWSAPRPIVIENYYTYRSGLTMTLSADAQFMILALERDNSRGGTDLFLCARMSEGWYGSPINLGTEINTSSNETTPHLSSDNKRLYFSSNRPDGLGGMDIYFSERLDDTWAHWSAARRFVEPINSKYDDSYPYFNPATGQLYFASRRGYSSDIFRVQIAPPAEKQDSIPMTVVVPTKPTVAAAVVLPIVTAAVVERVAEILIIECAVQHSKTNEALDADLILRTPGQPDFIATTTSGRAMIPVIPGVHYELIAQRDGFIHRPKSVYFDPNISTNLSREQLLLLEPIEVGANIKIQNISFKKGDPEIMGKSFAELDYLANLMLLHAGMAIRIEGHTDNYGDTRANQKLSEERARAVRDYLIRKNISPVRIDAIGFGGTRPIAPSDTEANKSLNRRVEIKITKTGN